jgi:ATP-dependent RNA helicase DDX56/DBP9
LFALKMKRKLDQNDAPEEVRGQASSKSLPKFEELKLDARLLRAITNEKFTKPTPVQAEAIPLALAGKDVLGMDFPSCMK